ncbi:uncharacterized protein LOC119991476 [Tripterygium wilfordii]|uniref:uncharacterized protein LOC119991476 n=1 Tax=Tripterygium wilfordii TaxID=458696 RepID=UPI0018F822A0|nr:uncharacterized protein LOC119991476 [Tripterygium wilfordii]
MTKSQEEARTLLEKVAKTNTSWPTERPPQRQGNPRNADVMTALAAMAKKIDALTMNSPQGVHALRRHRAQLRSIRHHPRSIEHQSQLKLKWSQSQISIDRTTADQAENSEKLHQSRNVQPRFAVELDWPDSSLPAPPVKAYINIPFAEALEQMPSYAKFMKGILSKKRRLKDYESVQLTEECSAIVQQKLPIKKKDPKSFTIPCTIGSTLIERALCDLGASINLMPLSIAKLIGLHEISPTTMFLVMADRSIKYPHDIIKDVLIKVDELVFPVDFVILDMEEDSNTLIILERPFLRTGRTLIDVEKGTLVLRIADEQVTFKVFETTKYPEDGESCFRIDTVDHILTHTYAITSCQDPFETCLVNEDALECGDDDAVELMHCLESMKEPKPRRFQKFEPLGVLPSRPQPSIVEAPTLTLKPLPSHLRYAYLGSSNTLPVIISSNLNPEEEDKLLRVLREHKMALGWTIEDIQGIIPTMCMHRILMEEDYKSSVEHQRRLNPNMKDVVKAEILELIDAGIIYPISDSSWVSPVQVVPKKGGITVVKSEKNELIPTRTTTGYNQIPIAPEDQEKTTFTCPFDTFAYKRTPFDLCNTPATFQRRFIKDFSKITKPLCEQLLKDVKFHFTKECLEAFTTLKERLTTAPLITSPDWNIPFELVCDASDYAMGAILGQRKNKILHVIYYASRTLNDARLNYTTTEKELLAVVFALDKFRSYLIEFDLEIWDKKGSENVVADHLSRLLEGREEVNIPIKETFPDEQLFANHSSPTPWYADFVNFLAKEIFPPDLSHHQRKRFLHLVHFYYWEEPFLWKQCADQVIRRCVPEEEMISILRHCHSFPCGGHFGGNKTAAKVLQFGFYWPTLFKDAHSFVLSCDECQRTGNISNRNQMPLTNILEVELFDV